MTDTSYRCILRCPSASAAWLPARVSRVRGLFRRRLGNQPIAWCADLEKEPNLPMSTLSEATAPVPQSPTVAARTVDAMKIYGKGDNEVRALDGVTVDFATGVFTAIMGPSGSGKSTLMHCCRRARHPHLRRGVHRRARPQQHERARAHDAAPRPTSASSSRPSTWCRRSPPSRTSRFPWPSPAASPTRSGSTA